MKKKSFSVSRKKTCDISGVCACTVLAEHDEAIFGPFAQRWCHHTSPPLDPPPDVWPTFTWWLQVSPKPENTKKNHQNHVGIISINFGCIIIGWSPVQCRLRIFIQILQNKKFPMILFRSTGDDQRASYFFVQILSYLTPSNIRLLHELYLWYNSPFLFSKYLQNLINLYTHQCLSLLMKTFSRIPIKTNGSMFYL